MNGNSFEMWADILFEFQERKRDWEKKGERKEELKKERNRGWKREGEYLYYSLSSFIHKYNPFINFLCLGFFALTK